MSRAFSFALALCAFSPAVLASLTFVEQTGQITVHGQEGTFSATAPSSQPWFQTVNAGAGGPIWFAQSFMFSSWTSTSMIIYAEALVSPGIGTPVLTQSITDVSIRFSVAAPTDVRILFSDAPDQAGPNVSLNTHTMRLVNHATNSTLVEGLANNIIVSLAPGQYRFEGHNAMGNIPTNLALSDGSRMLSMQLDVVPAPAGTGVMLIASMMCFKRRRSCGAR